MEAHDLSAMTKGWFVGNFSPTVLRTGDVEVAVKEYRAGDAEAEHYHMVATEITVVVSGRVRMNGKEYGKNAIVTIQPGESADFLVLEDAVTVVVKHPGASNDKFLGRRAC